MIRGLSKSSSNIMTKFSPVKFCIFDMDGLILDTERLYTKATQNILDPYGLTYTWDVKQSVMGLQREAISRRIVKTYDLPITWEEYADLLQEQIELLMGDCAKMPDTEKIYEGIFTDLVRKFGKEFPYATRMRLLGTTEQKSCSICVNDLSLPVSVEEFQKDYRTLANSRLGDVSVMRGAERLVRHLHANNVPICLATSSGAESVAIKTSKHQDLFSLFHHKVMGSSDPEVKEGKPAPDIFLIAASRFSQKPKADECLVFEDAPNGVTAARAAGMQVVMVPDDHVSEEQRKGATLVLKSLEDFKPEQFGLPAFPPNSS